MRFSDFLRTIAFSGLSLLAAGSTLTAEMGDAHALSQPMMPVDLPTELKGNTPLGYVIGDIEITGICRNVLAPTAAT